MHKKGWRQNPGVVLERCFFTVGLTHYGPACRGFVHEINPKVKGKTMKLKYPLAVLTAAFVLAGCDQSKQAGKAGSESSADINAPPAEVQQEAEKKDTANVPPAPEQKEIAKKEVSDVPPMPEQKEIVKQEVKEPVDVYPYPTENRDEFAASMQQKLTDLDQQLAELSDTIVSLNTDEAAQATLNSLQEHRAQLGTLLDELNKASPEAWDDAKMAFESSLTEFEKAYQEAKDIYGG